MTNRGGDVDGGMWTKNTPHDLQLGRWGGEWGEKSCEAGAESGSSEGEQRERNETGTRGAVRREGLQGSPMVA